MADGGLKVRQADPADTPRTVAFVASVLRETGAQKAPLYDEPFYRWQYDPGRDVLLIADDGERVLAHYPLVANHMTWQGRPLLAGVCQDLCVDASLRRQGVFREMGEQATAMARAKGMEMLFAFPNVRSINGFLRHHGYTLVGEYAWRMAVMNPLGLGALSGLVWQRPDAGELRGGPWTAPRAGADDGRLATVHDDRFLNWRFGARPHTAYAGLVAGGSWLAARVIEVKGVRVGLIMDVLAGRDEQNLAALLASARRYFREQKAALALLAATPSLGHAGVFTRAGYFPLPAKLAPRRLFLVARALVPEMEPLTHDLDRWSLTLADWDVF